MKYSLFLFLFICGRLVAQVPNIQWEKTYGGSGDDFFYSMIFSKDSMIVFAGVSDSDNGYVVNNHQFNEAWILKTDLNGNLKWNHCYGGNVYEMAYSIANTLDSGFIIGARANDDGGDVSGIHTPIFPSTDYWIIKTDSVGLIEWKKCYGGSGGDDLYTIIQTPDSGYLAVGKSPSPDYDVPGIHMSYDLWALKLHNSGNIDWSKCYGGTYIEGPVGYQSCIQNADGSYSLLSITNSHDGDVSGRFGDVDIWVVNISDTGNIIWQKCFGGSNLDDGYAIISSDHNGFYMAGITDSNDGNVSSNSGADMWVFKADSIGTIIWETCFGDTNAIAQGNAICKTNDGGIVVVGKVYGNGGQVSGNHGNWDEWVVKIDSLGNFEWGKTLGGSQDDEAEAVLQTLDGGFLVAGYTKSNDGDILTNLGGTDAWVVKLSPPGLSIKDPQYDIMDLSVLQNENSITARFFSRKSEKMDLIIYNLEGQVIAQKTVEVNIGVNYFEVPMEFTTGNYILNVTNSYFTTSKEFFLK